MPLPHGGRFESGQPPTFGEAWRVVVDVAEADVDGGGAGQAAQLTPHVLGLDQNLVLLLHLPVHVGQRRLDHPWGGGRRGRWRREGGGRREEGVREGRGRNENGSELES